MKLRVAKIVMRVAGTLGGLLGLGMLCLMAVMLYHSIAERNLWMILFIAFPLPFAAYFIYVAYLVWFRFSPLAVRHFCGALGLYMLTLLTKLFEPFRHSAPEWPALAFFGCLIVVYFVYRIASKRLSRFLFPENISLVQS